MLQLQTLVCTKMSRKSTNFPFRLRKEKTFPVALSLKVADSPSPSVAKDFNNDFRSLKICSSDEQK